MKQVLIVDDDVYVGDMLEETLSKENYRVLRAYSGTEALLLLATVKPDLVLLDLMLPGASGEEVLSKIKNIPVIVISAKVDVDSKVSLLLDGAVDYLTKPFETKELLARMTVALRKVSVQTSSVLFFGDLRLDTLTHDVFAGDHPVKLTRTEYAILKTLMQTPGQVTTRSSLLDRISDDTPDCTENSLKMHISNLRKKLRAADGRDHIESVWGIGFRLSDE